jgi:hypothetical protein
VTCGENAREIRWSIPGRRLHFDIWFRNDVGRDDISDLIGDRLFACFSFWIGGYFFVWF